MKKKKKSKLLIDLQNIIKSNKQNINLPLLDDKLICNKTKIDNLNCNIYKWNNLITKNNNIQFEKLKDNKDTMIKTLKYKLLPTEEQKKILINYCDAYIEMYNNVIKFIKDKRKEQTIQTNKHNLRYCDLTYNFNISELKKYFKNKKEQISNKYKANKHLLDYAMNDCLTMLKSIKINQILGNIYHSKMRYLKKSKKIKIFKVEKQMCSLTSFCSSILGKELKVSPVLNYKEECQTVYTIQYNSTSNKFILLRRIKIEKENLEKQNNVIAIDPGIRDIINGISNNHIIEIGNNVDVNIKKEYKKIKKIEYLNKIKKINNSKKNKQIKKIKEKIKNYVSDIQWKIANYLTRKYDHIVIGNFSTSRLKKINKSNELLNVMKDLNMFKLREKIKYKCLIRNKKYLKVNEAFTTQCCINCSAINNIGSSKVYECSNCNKRYSRDIKSAGCIYLKSLK
mgnify:FL=1